jgi:hypothetical protein
MNESGRVPLDAGVKRAMENGLEQAIKNGSLPEGKIASIPEWDRKRQAQIAVKLMCPESLEKLAVENGAEIGMTVEIVYDFRAEEWVVRMTTARGVVEAVPELPDHKNVMLDRLLDRAWWLSLNELGLLR